MVTFIFLFLLKLFASSFQSINLLFLLVSLPVLRRHSLPMNKLEIGSLPKRFWSLIHREQKKGEKEL